MAGCAAIVRPKSIPAVTQSQSYPPPADLRDFRYCEIIPVFQTRLTFNVEVYNTIGGTVQIGPKEASPIIKCAGWFSICQTAF